MNPSQSEGVAKKVSENLGYSTDIVSGEKVLKIEASEVAGAKYSENIFVFSNKPQLGIRTTIQHQYFSDYRR